MTKQIDPVEIKKEEHVRPNLYVSVVYKPGDSSHWVSRAFEDIKECGPDENLIFGLPGSRPVANNVKSPDERSFESAVKLDGVVALLERLEMLRSGYEKTPGQDCTTAADQPSKTMTPEEAVATLVRCCGSTPHTGHYAKIILDFIAAHKSCKIMVVAIGSG